MEKKPQPKKPRAKRQVKPRPDRQGAPTSKESSARLFHRYVWLVDTIYRHNGHITFEEINDKWTRSPLNTTREDFPLKTFHNHRRAIEIMFGINIECNKRNNYTYSIENADDMERGGVRSWLLNTFAVNNLINESHQLKHRILFEQIPSGQLYLTPLLEAMRDGVAVEITYQNYWHAEPYTFEVQPYCVKVFRQRWYLVANNDYKGDIRIYALDRIKALQPTENKFTLPAKFDAEEYFATCFGIIHDGKAESITLRVATDNNKHLYFRSLPLHSSQKEIAETDDYVDFEYFLRPTYDFRQEILSHGDEVEVLSPEWFRKEVAEQIEEMQNLYNGSNKAK